MGDPGARVGGARRTDRRPWLPTSSDTDGSFGVDGHGFRLGWAYMYPLRSTVGGRDRRNRRREATTPHRHMTVAGSLQTLSRNRITPSQERGGAGSGGGRTARDSGRAGQKVARQHTPPPPP